MLKANLGKDAKIVTNKKGGSQSDAPFRFDLIDSRAMFALAQILDHGAKKYGENNWRKIDCEDHLNRSLIHAYAWLAGDKQDDHLEHFFCRAMMALAKKLENDK